MKLFLKESPTKNNCIALCSSPKTDFLSSKADFIVSYPSIKADNEDNYKNDFGEHINKDIYDLSLSYTLKICKFL